MFSKLRSYALYLILLPVFFVLHGCLENYGFVSFGEGALLTLIYTACTLAVAIVCWLFLRNIPKAGLVAFMVMVIYFFFGALHDLLKNHTHAVFSKYSVLLGVLFLLIVAAILYLRRSDRTFKRLTAFLNLLFIIYILVDVSSLVSKSMHRAETGLSVYSFAKNDTYQPCDTCHKPDIYFLLMDGYASTVALAKWYQYHNDLDSFLLQRKFSIQANSRSNYNITPFSMASILNMSYLKGLADPSQVTVTDYSNCEAPIRNNEVIKTLNAAGYDILNYSIFNLAGHPTLVEQTFLPLNTRLITERTMLACLRKDCWQLATWYPFKWFWGRDIMTSDRNNQQFIDLVKTSAAAQHTKPRFVYAHFFLPHFPYYYDKNGKRRDPETLVRENNVLPLSSYLEYVTYANSRIREMITAIQQKAPSAVIILMGDHGHREGSGEAFPVQYFMNMNAVYYPDNDYKGLYDSISGVNQFRVVFNKLFKQNLPLLPDSSILLKDQPRLPGTPAKPE